MINLVENELKEQEKFSVSENGSVGYKSSGSRLVDLNFRVSSFRNCSDEEIAMAFYHAYVEDKVYALKWLFFARDIREGLGERRLFRVCYDFLIERDLKAACLNLELIPEFGRWDDLVYLLGINDFVDEKIIDIIQTRLDEDLICLKAGEPVSLLGKWLPSENASSKKTKSLARKVRKMLGMSSKEYRLLLSKLRKHSNVVEVKMCNNDWETINYENVPSLANLQYKNAFLKHDTDRRKEYLNSVTTGKSKINMKVATPVDIIAKYKQYDETLEIAWKNLKNIKIKDTLVVADGSGSMLATCGAGGRVRALDVANALAIYTSENNSNIYKNKYITFSKNPQFVDFSNEKTLFDKIRYARKFNEISNTNIQAVFQLILETAIKHKVPKNEMIKNILIISDMEFDTAQTCGFGQNTVLKKPLFKEIEYVFNKVGYDLPKLIFWNVNSRTNVIPIKENDMGVTLVSGFSQNVLKMVMSEKYNPYDILIETLDKERYNCIKS